MAYDLELKGSTVIVTGARSGIGRATAVAFGRQGANVVLAGRKPCDDTLAQVKAAGGAGISVCCDVSSEEDVIRLVDTAVGEFGGLDAAVNCAGMNIPPTPFFEVALGDFEKVMAIDARGTFLCMLYEAKAMKKGGAIVNIASVAGVIADPGMVPYVGAKHAVVGMSKAAGIELASTGIRVNCICPGLVESELTQPIKDNKELYEVVAGYNFQKRMAKPEEIADMCMMLCSPASTFINGSVFVIDGGQTAH